MKIECCGLTATQTKQLIDKEFADKVVITISAAV